MEEIFKLCTEISLFILSILRASSGRRQLLYKLEAHLMRTLEWLSFSVATTIIHLWKSSDFVLDPPFFFFFSFFSHNLLLYHGHEAMYLDFEL